MAVSELPGNPNAVWTVRRHVEGINPSFFLCVKICNPLYPFWETVSAISTMSPLSHY